jgi:hypothetical protein
MRIRTLSRTDFDVFPLGAVFERIFLTGRTRLVRFEPLYDGVRKMAENKVRQVAWEKFCGLSRHDRKLRGRVYASFDVYLAFRGKQLTKKQIKEADEILDYQAYGRLP